jgi:Xaa-Pro aminopeptidase
VENLVVSENEYKTRESELLEKIGVDFAVIFNRADLFYYSNTGYDGVVTVSNSLQRYVRRNIEDAKQESILPVDLMQSFRLFKDLGSQGEIKTLGLELDILPYRTVEYLSKAFNQPEIVDISGILRQIRSVKSRAEQELMKQAMQQTDASFEYIQDRIKPGLTELEVAADIEYFLRKEGHPGMVNVRMFHHNLTSNAYVMSGESTGTLNSLFGPVSGTGLCKIHKNGPSRRKIKNNEAVLIDTTGVVEGYTGDETRTFFMGNPDQRLLDGYEAAKQLQELTGKIMKHGALPENVFSELNNLAKELGQFENFMGRQDDKVSFIGHGVGLELDDLPIITDKYNEPLQSGNIVAVEPKFIYDQPRSGVGIEDCWIVGENGSERITKFPW